jgi:hypothetical protein
VTGVGALPLVLGLAVVVGLLVGLIAVVLVVRAGRGRDDG